MPVRHTRKSEEKLRLFSSFFQGLTDVYGTYDPVTGRARQVKAPVTDKVLMAHLTGKQPYGVYLLVKNKTKAIAVDFDTQDHLPPIEFVAKAKHYDLSTYIERSKSKGHHAWIFFNREGVIARKARLVTRHILEEIEQPQTEIFPKQDEIGANMYGNYINAPLFAAHVPEGKTVFVDPANFTPYPNQWDLLRSIKRHDESVLDEIIEINDLSDAPQHQPLGQRQKDVTQDKFGLPPCVRKMLSEGVTEFQRVGCFRLAIQLGRIGLPYDMAVAVLKTWALKNKPSNGKGVIREQEILDQTSYAYKNNYPGYGCESPAIQPFCETSCPVRKWKENNKRIS